MSPKIISSKTMFKYESNDILSVKSSVKFNGGLINHDRCSTSVEGTTARESQPACGAVVKPSYHKTPPLLVISGLVK